MNKFSAILLSIVTVFIISIECKSNDTSLVTDLSGDPVLTNTKYFIRLWAEKRDGSGMYMGNGLTYRLSYFQYDYILLTNEFDDRRKGTAVIFHTKSGNTSPEPIRVTDKVKIEMTYRNWLEFKWFSGTTGRVFITK